MVQEGKEQVAPSTVCLRLPMVVLQARAAFKLGTGGPLIVAPYFFCVFEFNGFVIVNTNNLS